MTCHDGSSIYPGQTWQGTWFNVTVISISNYRAYLSVIPKVGNDQSPHSLNGINDSCWNFVTSAGIYKLRIRALWDSGGVQFAQFQECDEVIL
jgi:hypothetical protein